MFLRKLQIYHESCVANKCLSNLYANYILSKVSDISDNKINSDVLRGEQTTFHLEMFFGQHNHLQTKIYGSSVV